MKRVVLAVMVGVLVVSVGAYMFFGIEVREEETSRRVEKLEKRVDGLESSLQRLSVLVGRIVTLNQRGPGEVEPTDAEGGDKLYRIERQLDDLSGLISPYKDIMERELRLGNLREKARRRMELDEQRFEEAELRQIERLYQTDKAEPYSEERIASLEALVAEHPGSNRAGCATLYLAQMSEGDRAESYFRKAIDEYGDSMYGDGVEVGAYARYLLSKYYERLGKVDAASELLEEMSRMYPDAVDHQGNRLAPGA